MKTSSLCPFQELLPLPLLVCLACFSAAAQTRPVPNPQLASKDLNARVDALGDKVDVLGDKFEEKYNALRSEFVSVKTEVASGFHSLQLALDNAVLRGEKENWREIADLRERMTRLEDHVRGTPPQ